MFFQEHLARVASRVVAGLLAATVLASCGGGTYQVRAFTPGRILSFGDENSVLVPPDGRAYSINGISSVTDLIDCTVSPIWTQLLALSYGMVYSECNPASETFPAATSFAAVGATIDDVRRQVETFQSSDSFLGNDLVTLYVGLNDLLSVYSASNGQDEPELLVEMRARGAALASLVNAVAATGAKVLVLTIPEMGVSPFAVKENERADFDRALLLAHMSETFNRSMRSNLLNDGSKIGLVLVDDYVQSAARSPTAFGFASGSVAGCLDSAPLPSCSTDTITLDPVSGQPGVATQFLWADATHLGSVAQRQIGGQAISRSHSNPF